MDNKPVFRADNLLLAKGLLQKNLHTGRQLGQIDLLRFMGLARFVMNDERTTTDRADDIRQKRHLAFRLKR